MHGATIKIRIFCLVTHSTKFELVGVFIVLNVSNMTPKVCAVTVFINVTTLTILYTVLLEMFMICLNTTFHMRFINFRHQT